MNGDMAAFYAERAEILGGVYLTRRDDLRVSRIAYPDAGVNLLVTLVRDGVSTGRVFGVQVEAREEPIPCTDEIGSVSSPSSAWRVADVPFPVCQFLFSMSDDAGYYRWLKEPADTPVRAPGLREAHNAAWAVLDAEGTTRIVDAVNAWYDAQPRTRAA